MTAGYRWQRFSAALGVGLFAWVVWLTGTFTTTHFGMPGEARRMVLVLDAFAVAFMAAGVRHFRVGGRLVLVALIVCGVAVGLSVAA